ncbi:hypothetical protein Ahia01_000540800 [Argonauta hians]
MKAFAFLCVLILPGVHLSDPREHSTYWNIMTKAVQRYNQHIRGLRTGVFNHHKVTADLTDKVVADLTDKVVADLTDKVVADLTDKVVADLTDKVVADLTDKVVADLTDKVVADLTDKVVADLASEMSADLTEKVASDLAKKVSVDLANKLTPDLVDKVVADLTDKVTADLASKVSSDLASEVVADLANKLTPDLVDKVTADLTDKVVADLAASAPSFDEIINKTRDVLSEDLCSSLTGRHNVSDKCCEDSITVLSSLLHKEMWAIQMVDAYGKLSSGVLQGDIHFPGSYDQCLSIKVPKSFHTKYCQLVVPTDQFNVPVSLGARGGLKLGMCVPDSCSEIELASHITTGIIFPLQNIAALNISTHTVCEKEKQLDSRALFSIVVCSVYLLVVMVATLHDVITCHILANKSDGVGNVNTGDVTSLGPPRPVTQNGTGSQVTLVKVAPEGEVNEKGTLSKLLQCFSVYHNGSKLLNTDQGVATLTCIHGIRFLSMTWVLLGHTYIFIPPVLKNGLVVIQHIKEFSFQVVINGTLSVDTFFLLSGLLVAYSTLKALDARQGKMNWIYFYVHRYWRLTPPMLLVMMVYLPLFRYIGTGPFWRAEGPEKNFCEDSWFYNLFYISNFQSKQSEMCMPWLWYLANDMQFYWISPLILIPLFRWPKAGHVIIGVLLLVTFTCSGVIGTQLKDDLSFTNFIKPGHFVSIYIKPWNRIGPYLVGLLVGYHLYRTKCHFKINKCVTLCVWLVATVAALSVLYGLYDVNNGHLLPQGVASLYSALSRTVWGACIGWVVFACCTGNAGYVNTLLSWKGFITVSRLTYCAYLTHPIVLYYLFLSQRYPLAPTHVTFVYIFMGCLLLTFLVASVVSVLFEAPLMCLEGLMLKRWRTQSTTNLCNCRCNFFVSNTTSSKITITTIAK